MRKRLTALGYVLAAIGLAFLIAGGVAYSRVQQGYDSLKAFSAAQDVRLTYNDDGQLVDRGTTEGAEAILATLRDDWKYPLVEGDLNPNDPLVNTGTEYMFQMATVSYHVLNGTQTVVLDEDVEYEGVLYEAGTHEFNVEGRYWTDFDRSHPIEGVAREQAWSGTVHGLIGELGVGTVTHSTLQMGLALAGLFGALGGTLMLTGGGLAWAMRGSTATRGSKEIEFPDTLPERLAKAEDERESVTV